MPRDGRTRKRTSRTALEAHLSKDTSHRLHGHGQLAQAYHAFLQSIQPVDSWSNVGTLSEPIPPRADYPIDWSLVQRWTAACPALASVMEQVHDFDLIASALGWNYAWTRLPHHLYLLDAIEQMAIDTSFRPSIVLEPGCFTGGLLHYLANHWRDVPCVGVDVSPVALDVCSYYSDALTDTNRPLWLEADFSQFRPSDLPDALGACTDGGLVIFSNVIESLASSFARFPYLDQWSAKARLISYWVNQGAVVLLAERHSDPNTLMHTIVNSADWQQPGCTAAILREFTAPITTHMTPDKPLGEWSLEAGCVLRFSPPRHSNRLAC